MVKVKKRASKRLAVAQREKIKKKVREHHRKSRKEAKKNPQWKSKLKKDPGIPNSYPYKEQLLNEIEQKRRVAEEEKQAAKEARRAEKQAAKDAGSDEETEDDEADAHDVSAMLDADSIKVPLVAPLFRGSLEELIDSDEIKTYIYALDARDPQSFRSAWFEDKMVTKKGKKMVFALGRADLVPAETLANWIAYLSSTTKYPIFPISVCRDEGLDGMTGAEELVAALQLKGKKKGDVAVVGLGHSGRTSIADAVIEAIGAPEDEDEKDEDSEWPAVLDTQPLVAVLKHETVEESDEDEEERFMEKLEIRAMQTLMRNQGKVQKIAEPLPLVWALISRVAHPEDMMLAFNTPVYGSFVPARASLADDDLDEEEKQQIIAAELRAKVHADTEEFLISLARAVGALKRKDVPDPIGASRTLLRRWAHQELGYYSKAPALPAGANLEDAKAKIAPLGDAVVPRKEWRKRWSALELRLKPLSSVMGRDALVLDAVTMYPPPPEEMDDEDDQEEMEDEQDDEEQEEDVPAPVLKSILKKTSKRSQADEPDLSRKARRASKKTKVSITTAPAPKSTTLSKKTSAAAATAGPAPGERYDFSAFF